MALPGSTRKSADRALPGEIDHHRELVVAIGRRSRTPRSFPQAVGCPGISNGLHRRSRSIRVGDGGRRHAIETEGTRHPDESAEEDHARATQRR
jgi:hypothetical protein